MSRSKRKASSPASNTGCSGAVSRSLLGGVAGGLLLVGIVAWWQVYSRRTSDTGAVVSANEAASVAPASPKPTRPDPEAKLAAPTADSRPPKPATVAASATAETAPASVPTPATPETRELIKSLYSTGLELGADGITTVQAQQWKSNLLSLVQSGPAGVAAIREFMEQATDYNLAALQGGNKLGFPTLRTALIDALVNIGGAESTDLLLRTLQSTAEPREIALLARALDQMSPAGEYRAAAVNAAREALTMAAEDRLTGFEVAPLFETFAHFGDAAAVADLQTAVAKWDSYAKIALAQMPDGTGVPALIALANNAASPQAGDVNFTYGMLAQVAVSYPDAASALLDQARENRIPEAAWPAIASALSGVTMQFSNPALGSSLARAGSRAVSYGSSQRNQQYYSVPIAAQWSPDQIQQQVRLIDSLMALNPGATAVSALQKGRSTLATLSVP